MNEKIAICAFILPYFSSRCNTRDLAKGLVPSAAPQNSDVGASAYIRRAVHHAETPRESNAQRATLKPTSAKPTRISARVNVPDYKATAFSLLLLTRSLLHYRNGK